MDDTPTAEELRAIGHANGLDAVGVARAEIFESTRRDLLDRKAQGFDAGMQFTYRNPERSTDPSRALPGARSLVVGALGYLRDHPAGAAPTAPMAEVARYAREDHYAELRRGLEAIAAALERSGHRTRVLVDDNALVDREAAYRAGLGWYGKNANLLLPGHGSWFVLGSVLTDADLEAAPARVPDGCGSCRRCLDGCPTGAIVEAGVIDANRCLAWLVQAEGVFPLEHRAALGARLYGCDECQEVCPPNRRESRQPVRIAGVGAEPAVPVLELLTAADDVLMARYGRWYIPRRDPRYLRRNALVVLGNVGSANDPAVVEALRRWLASDDGLLRAHAVWAATRLGLDELVAPLRDDPDPFVQDELGRR